MKVLYFNVSIQLPYFPKNNTSVFLIRIPKIVLKVWENALLTHNMHPLFGNQTL